MAYYNGKKVISLIHFNGQTAKKTFSESGKSTIIYDLTNTKWLFNDQLSDFSPNGTNMTTNVSRTYEEKYRIDFKIKNGNNQESILFKKLKTSSGLQSTMSYSRGGTAYRWAMTNYQRGFTSAIAKTITITGGDDVKNAKLINWLLQNATQIFD